ncbi:NAD-P-binding protein [Russula vinacea]|nr:NAD-P-binding protein [Russula vinacea]
MSPKVVLGERIASQGCKVYATARNVERMQALQHSQIDLLPLDVIDDSAIKTVINTIVANEGKIDIVVNNAGVGCYGPTLELPFEQVQAAFDTNVFSVLRVNRAAFPHMAARKQGMFITIGSVVADCPLPWGGIYAATKSAVHTLTDALEMECRPFNIKVLLVAPGSVRSNIAANQSYNPLPDTLYAKYTKKILARRDISQSSPMAADVFAKGVVTKALAPSPPSYMSLGRNSTVFRFLTWFPRQWVLSFFWKYFGDIS